MNLTLNYLFIKNYFYNSPFILLKENKNFENINFININFLNSFNSFYFTKKFNFNLNFYNNNFKNFLNNIIKISNTLIIISRIEYNIAGNIYINNTIFENCTVNGRAGAILISNSLINFYSKNTAFLRCTSTGTNYNAGALVIQFGNNSNIKNLCFERCSSNGEPTSYQIISHANDIKNTEFNYTIEYLGGTYQYQSTFPSIIGGNNYLIFNNNNISSIIGLTFGGGFGYARSLFIYSKFNQIKNCIGNNMLLCHYISKNFNIKNKNFINNTCNQNWFGFYSSSLILTFINCFFYQITEKGISSNSIIFNSCYFEKEILNNFLLNCEINSNCIFNINLNYKNSLNFINSLNCWNFKLKKIEIIKKKNFSFNNLILLNFII